VVEAGVEDLAVGAESLLAGGVGGPEGSDEDVAVELFELDGAGEQSLQYRADAADLLDGFVGDV
jgi:hypothetical protein